MRRTFAVLAATLIAAGALNATASQVGKGFRLHSPTVAANSHLTLDQVYNGFGCSGRNRSPALEWSGAPAGTRSFAVTVYDPDAPTGSGWWHWVVYDIPPSASGLAENAGTADGASLPAGARQGRTDFGSAGFGGACPPAGDKPHRYFFTVYALKVGKLEVGADSTAALIGYLINANQLAKAQFTARYGR